MKIFHDNEAKQINVLDERFYISVKNPDKYYPSVTTILDVFPKGYGYITWLKDVGHNAEDILERAATQGSNIHNMIDRYINGETIKWLTDDGKGLYTLTEWQMFSRFVEFWNLAKPEVIVHEFALVSETLGFGGTVDFIGRINGDVYLIDWKSSNYIHKTHELQIAAYAMGWNEMNPDTPITKTAILWLNAQTRGEDKKGKKLQGRGWQLKDDWGRDYTEAYKIFAHAHALWKEENPNYRPANLLYPSEYTKVPFEPAKEEPKKKRTRKSKSVKEIIDGK